MSNEFPAYDESSPEQVAMAGDTVELRARDQADSALAVFSTYDGRAFVWQVLQMSRVDEISFVGEAPITMSFNDGGRRVGKEVRDLVLTVAPEAYIMMRQEALLREQRYAEQVGFNSEE